MVKKKAFFHLNFLKSTNIKSANSPYKIQDFFKAKKKLKTKVTIKSNSTLSNKSTFYLIKMSHSVKKILSGFTQKREVFYEIEWEEEGSSSTFEPIESLTQCNDILQEYLHLKNKNKVNILLLKYSS